MFILYLHKRIFLKHFSLEKREFLQNTTYIRYIKKAQTGLEMMLLMYNKLPSTLRCHMSTRDSEYCYLQSGTSIEYVSLICYKWIIAIRFIILICVTTTLVGVFLTVDLEQFISMNI